MENLEFIKRIGKIVTDISEIKEGDIVGTAHLQHDVRIYYIQNIILDKAKHWQTFVPRAYFKPQHIGLVISKNEVHRHYIHFPMLGKSYLYSWGDYKEKEPKDIDFYEDDKKFDIYLITDEKYKNLGKLLNEVEIPSWSFLCQTTKGEEDIYKFIQGNKENFEKAKEIFNKIKLNQEQLSC